MAVRKQRRMKTLKGRTVTVKNRSHWEKILSKMGDRLLIVHYSASWSAACKRMRPFLSEVSRKPQFNHVTFVELDVSAESTSELAQEQGVQALPTVQAWKLGKCIETVVGGTPAQLLEVIQNNAGERPAEGGSGLRRVLKGVAIGVAAAAVALLGARAVMRMRQPMDESLLERKRRELRELRRRIETLRKAGRAGRRLGPKDAADRKEKLRELRGVESGLLNDLHNLTSKEAAADQRWDDEEEDEDDDWEREAEGEGAEGRGARHREAEGREEAAAAEDEEEEEEEDEEEGDAGVNQTKSS